MKKIFRHFLILSLFIILALVFFSYQGWLKGPQDFFFSITSPVQKIVYQSSQKINGFVSFLFKISQLDQENIDLQKENQELLAELAELKEVNRENEFLRQQLGLPLLQDEELILANIISQESSGLGKYFLIDKGRKDGVQNESVVITAGNILVGQIAETTNSFSKVRLIIDSGSRVNALIQESELTGLVTGDQSSLVIGLLPQREPVREGQIVATSGLAGIFKKGLLIGQIEELLSADVQISQQARIKPAADFNALERVFVIKK
jgi:rod shape-determining protein MreC